MKDTKHLARAPVQGDDTFELHKDHSARKIDAKPPGWIDWAEHVDAWVEYAKQHGTQQSAERMAQRGGFGYWKLTQYLVRKPKTWRPR